MVFGPPFPLLPHSCFAATLSAGVEAPRDFTASHTYGGRFFPGGALNKLWSRLMRPDLDLRQGLVLLTAAVRGPHRCAERATNTSGPCLTLGLVVCVFYGSLLSTRKTLAELTEDV